MAVQWRTLWQEVIVADVLQGELLLEGQQMADGLVQQLLLHSQRLKVECGHAIHKGRLHTYGKSAHAP